MRQLEKYFYDHSSRERSLQKWFVFKVVLCDAAKRLRSVGSLRNFPSDVPRASTFLLVFVFPLALCLLVNHTASEVAHTTDTDKKDAVDGCIFVSSDS